MQNSICLQKLDNASSSIHNLQCANKGTASDLAISDTAHSSHPSASNIDLQARSSSRLGPGASGAEPVTDSHESCEVILKGIFKEDCDTSPDVINEIAYATFKTVLPTFARENVISARILAIRDLSKKNGGEMEGILGSRPGALPSCIVELNSARLVREIMRAKRSLANNYLSTSNINQEFLSPESAACMPNNKIFINEMLP